MLLDENLNHHMKELLEALEQNDQATLEQNLKELRAADIAEILASLVDNDAVPYSRSLLARLPLDRRASVLGHMHNEEQLALIGGMEDEGLLALLEEMGSDERADLYKALDEGRREALLRRMAHQEREEVKRLASYDEGTAGALMTAGYVAIPTGITVSQAMMRVRQTAPDAETVYQLYIVDPSGELVGTMSLRMLMVASPAMQVDELMIRDVIHTHANTPQEDVARIVARYDLLALPVVDDAGRLVGIITHDDALDVMEIEATEDIHKGMSIGALDDGIGRVSLASLYKKRVTWLVLLVFGNLFSGAGLAYFEDMIAAHVALVFFLPLLIGSGGNAGAQAATLMVRGMATGEVGVKDWGKLLSRELLVAGALGLTMALAVSPIAYLRAGDALAVVIALSMVSIVLFGSLLGMCLPFVLDRLGWDPATASAPLVTTLIDATGVIIYFSIAVMILDIA
ncbi:magnesium transporter [Halomonas halocynthiae]|uniref:magnesium transporter n=1 Tax=Halomonas halocynthiae TaxID=176290 RepID=UPI00040944AC|nr:magnesium transporter [Halomonas halocynthiae]